MKIVLVLLYVLMQDGQPQAQLEQQVFATAAACAAEGRRQIALQLAKPEFVQGLYAECIEMERVEAKATK